MCAYVYVCVCVRARQRRQLRQCAKRAKGWEGSSAADPPQHGRWGSALSLTCAGGGWWRVHCLRQAEQATIIKSRRRGTGGAQLFWQEGMRQPVNLGQLLLPAPAAWHGIPPHLPQPFAGRLTAAGGLGLPVGASTAPLASALAVPFSTSSCVTCRAGFSTSGAASSRESTSKAFSLRAAIGSGACWLAGTRR